MRIYATRLACAVIIASGLPLLAQVEPTAGTWKTWVLTSAKEFPVPPPPSREVTAGELVWLKNFVSQTRQSAEGMSQMRTWTAGPPAYRWVERMLNLIETRGFSNPKNARNFALLNVAMYDATIAAWDAKYTYNRARPSVADPSIQTAIAVPQSPSYPSEHAATAGAAAEILAYLYPADAQAFRSLGRRGSARRPCGRYQLPDRHHCRHATRASGWRQGRCDGAERR